MRGKLKDLSFPDIDSVTGMGEPADSQAFGVLAEMSIGNDDSVAADEFFATVCSPSWLSRQCQESGAIWGRHMLIGPRFDRQAIREAIEVFCSKCSGGTWHEVAGQLQRLGNWEFESYDGAKTVVSADGSFGQLLAVDWSGRDLSHAWPDQPDSFRLPLQVTIGNGKGRQAVFDLAVTTPDLIVDSSGAGKFALGHGLLIVGDYDAARIRAAIKHKCEHLWGDTFEALVKRMSEYAPPTGG